MGDARGAAPREPLAYAGLSTVFRATFRSRDAIGAASAGLAINPRSQSCMDALVRALLVRPDWRDNAYQTAWSALAQSPEVAGFHVALGRALMGYRALDPAAAEFREALRLNPLSREAEILLNRVNLLLLFAPSATIKAIGVFWGKLSGRVRALCLAGLAVAGVGFGGGWVLLSWIALAAIASLSERSGLGLNRRSAIVRVGWIAGVAAAIVTATLAQGLILGPSSVDTSAAARSLPGSPSWDATFWLAVAQVAGGVLMALGLFPGGRPTGRFRWLPVVLVVAGAITTIALSPLLPPDVIATELLAATAGAVPVSYVVFFMLPALGVLTFVRRTARAYRLGSRRRMS